MDAISNIVSQLLPVARQILGIKLPFAGKTVDVETIVLVFGGVQLGLLVLKYVAAVLGALLKAATRKSIRSYGEWAVVTGATDGIGKAYAFQLAKRGLKVVLISRTKAKLDATADELKQKVSGATVQVVEADYSLSPSTEAGAAMYERIKAALAGKDIGVLVNNVGCSYPSALFFEELDKEAPGLTRTMVAMNVNSVVEMTNLVLPGMVKNRRGAIVNISSAAGRVPIGNPLYALYSGTKAFVDYFSRSLAHEYGSKGITVTCQVPYFVATKLAKIRVSSLTAPSPDTFAKAAITAIGDGAVTVPYWAHSIQDSVLQSLPEWLLSSYLVSLHKGLRARYLAKQAKDAKKQ